MFSAVGLNNVFIMGNCCHEKCAELNKKLIKGDTNIVLHENDLFHGFMQNCSTLYMLVVMLFLLLEGNIIFLAGVMRSHCRMMILNIFANCYNTCMKDILA